MLIALPIIVKYIPTRFSAPSVPHRLSNTSIFQYYIRVALGFWKPYLGVSLGVVW